MRRTPFTVAIAAVLAVLGLVGVGLLARNVFFAPTKITAYFPSATGIYPGDEVRVSGVKVGRIDGIEPQGTQATSGQRTAAWNTAPIVGRVVPRIGPLLGVMPDATRDIDISDLSPLVANGEGE